MQIGLIVHGRPDREKKFARLFDQNTRSFGNLALRIVTTRQKAESIEIAKKMATEGYSHIIAVGGDGSFNEVINGILASGNTSCIAGLFPFGTANDWSRSWPCFHHLSTLFEKIVSGSFRLADVGCLSFPRQPDRYFINIADIGLGADVVRDVNTRSKWLGPDLTYFTSIIKIFLRYKNKEILCETDDWKWQGKYKSLVIANGKSFGSGLIIAPEARPDDGWLDLVIVGDVSLLDYLRYLPALRRGEIIRHPKIIYRKVKAVTLTSAERNEVEADGESIGSLPASIQLLPHILRIL